MKAALTVLILGLIFINGEALRCRQCASSGRGSCYPREVTCKDTQDHCFSMIKVIGYNVYLTRGCISKANCMLMKSTFPETNCCNTDLCN